MVVEISGGLGRSDIGEDWDGMAGAVGTVDAVDALDAVNTKVL
jgi:hypothetical protein